MARQTCPKCGVQFQAGDAWAKLVVSLVNPAPAVRDMATQLRCPRCHFLFADSDLRYLAPWSKRARVLLMVGCLIILVWAIYQLL
jgi:uncharacterized C2H2 Zn-finger protein